MQQPASPWETRAPVAPVAPVPGHVTLVEGQTFCICQGSGDIRTDVSEGLYFLDTRVVSRWELRLNQHPLEALAVANTEPYSAIHVTRGAPAEGVADASVVVVRHRHVRGGMRERIVITNHGLEPAPLTLELLCGVDFADLFEVKESRVHRRGVHAQKLHARGLDFHHRDRGVDRTVSVRVDGAPQLDDGRITWSAVLAPAETWQLCLEVTVAINGEVSTDAFRCGDTDGDVAARGFDSWVANLPEVERDHDDFVDVVARAGRDLGALRIRDPETGLTVPAAGAPWFMTLFGRDSLLASWMALAVDPSLAEGVLLSLARLQGKRVDAQTEEQPGRIMHESRFGSAPGLSWGGSDTYYGTADATPLFVMLLGECRRWGVHEGLVSVLMPHVERALEWIETFGDRDGDGYVEYLRATPGGLANQGWKDSWDGVRFADGTLAEAPIALCEVQAYVYGAYVARAHFALHDGDRATFHRYRDKALDLRRRFNEDFWLEEQGTYALGLDADKRRIDAVTSNAGHCLWTGIAEPDRAARVAQRLMAPDMFSGWGIRTLATTMAAFNPVSYHNGSVWPHDNALCAAGLARYGHLEAAHRVIEAQLDVATAMGAQLPELFAGFDRAEVPVPATYPASCSPQAWAAGAPLLWLRILLGLEPGKDEDVFYLQPSLLRSMRQLRVRGIQIRHVEMAVSVDDGQVDVTVDTPVQIIRQRRGPLSTVFDEGDPTQG